jgi:hypothetical protein
MSEHMENPVLGDEREMQELSRLREKLSLKRQFK